MGDNHDFDGLMPLLDEIDRAAKKQDGLSVSDLFQTLGECSFGPLMLIPAIFIISPFSAIVGFDSLMGIFIAIVSGQMLFGRKHIWLPKKVLMLRIGEDRFGKIVDFMRPIGRWTDRFIHPRFEWLAQSPFSRVIAALCLAIGITMPPLEAIPFSNTAGAAVVSFCSLGISVRDGAMIAVALGLLVAAMTVGGYYAFL